MIWVLIVGWQLGLDFIFGWEGFQCNQKIKVEVIRLIGWVNMVGIQMFWYYNIMFGIEIRFIYKSIYSYFGCLVKIDFGFGRCLFLIFQDLGIS